MAKILFAVSAVSMVLAATPAAATILIFSTPGAVQPSENILFQGVDATGNLAFGVTNQTGSRVTFTGVEPLATPPQGQARLSAVDGGLSELSFALDSGIGFREVEFNIFGTQATATSAMLNFTDQFGTVFSNTFALSNGQNFFSARSIDQQFITNVSFLLNGNVQDVRQFRIGGVGIVPSPEVSGVVPEPASWAMMVLGFGLVGAGMRNRKSSMRTVIA